MTFYSEPVVGDSFFAREEVLKTLLKSADDIKHGYRHNIAVIGRGLIGKSSLLLHFLGIIKDQNRLLPIYINLKGLSFTEFVDNVINALLYHSLKKVRRLRKSDDSNYLTNCARKVFPKTSDLIKRIRAQVDDGHFNDAYSDLLDLCTVINSESGNLPVFVLDEFDLMSSFPVKRPFQILGQKIMVQQNTLFILSSSSTLTARKVLSEKLSLLFGGFELIDIGPFSISQAQAYIKQQSRHITISDELKEFILSFTGAHPFYLSSIMGKLKLTKRYGTERISSKFLSMAIAELLFDHSGAINQFFSHLLEGMRRHIRGTEIFDVLKLFLETQRASSIIKNYNISSVQLNNLLNNLQEVGVLSKSGALYALTDSLFRLWVEVRSRPRNLCFDFMPKEDAVDYVREVEERISSFKSARKRRFDDKIADLVSSFRNDQFFIDERVRLLPHLSYIRQERLDHDNVLITASGKRRWLFVVSAGKVTEELIFEMLERFKARKYSNAKVVLIAAADIDGTATLLAKQKRLWVWNRGDLNRLFQFYKGYSEVIA